jgi:hypothetical protein
MAPPQVLTAAQVGIRQPEPPEGRKMYPLNPPLDFVTGNETFQWKTLSLGNQPCSGIMSAWVDASALPTTNNLIISVNNGTQKFFVQGGTQGYIVITAQMPVTFDISVDGGTGLCQFIPYNYNALFTGGTTQAQPAPVASGSGGGAGSGASGGGAGGVHSGPGSRPVL